MKRWLVVATCFALFSLWVVATFSELRTTASINVFGSFWDSGRALWEGKNPYAGGPFTISWRAGPYSFTETNLNPPTLLPLLQLLAALDVFSAAKLWLILSAVLFALPALQLSRQARLYQVPWLFLLPLNGLLIGQIYAPLFALSVIAWLAFQKDRQVLAGIAIGIICAAKPNFCVWPLLLLLAGHWRVSVAAGMTGLVLLTIPALLYGPGIYQQWIIAAGPDNHGLFPADVSFNGLFSRQGLAPVGLICSVLVLIACSILAWRRRPNALAITSLALPIAILCSPLAWPHYALLLVPALLSREWTAATMLAALLLLMPAGINLATVGTPFSLGASLLYILPFMLLAWQAYMRVLSDNDAGLEPVKVSGD